MPLLPGDFRQLNWRAKEVGLDATELAPFKDALLSDLTMTGRNSSLPFTPPVPDGDLHTSDHYSGDLLADTRIALIGAGAGAIISGAHLTMRGAKAENITVFDPRGSYGGQWQDKRVRFAGYNNPGRLVFGFGFKHQVMTHLGDRSGRLMLDYLSGIATEYLADADFVPERVEKLQPNEHGDGWLLDDVTGTQTETDIVIMATGAHLPNRIDGPRIRSNLDDLPTVERHQRELSRAELASGRPILLIGIGNSTAAMLGTIQSYEDETGEVVDYKVLTDRSWGVINNPTENSDGKPLFRDPASGYLTGYSGDIERDRLSFERARSERRIIKSVKAINYVNSADGIVVVVESDNAAKQFYTDPQIFALIGHHPDLSLFEDLSKLPVAAYNRREHTNGRLVRAADGAVYTPEDGYNSNVYAIGACAAHAGNLNAAVLPGIQGQVPAMSLTMGVRKCAELIRLQRVSAHATNN